jgi:two-component system alkaline phosphatase synthesis response regulator PhoP
MSKRKILIVDDEPDLVETLKFRLEHEGYETITAINGWEALGAVRAQEPDLVLLDVMLPKENGYRVSKMIKEDIATGRLPKAIPVFLLTARNLSSDPGRESEFRNFSQADDVIYKPFEMEELIAQIAALWA